MKGGFGSPTSTEPGNAGTEFVNLLAPVKGSFDGYDNSLPCSKQTIPLPQTFRDAMSIREEVYAAQGVPLEAEFDDDDARAWHWVAFASVASHSRSPPKSLRAVSSNTPADDARRASATAVRVPVATIRLIPPPHGVDPYHTSAAEPQEPYIKLGRLAALPAYRGLGLAKLLINTALDFATRNPDKIYSPPSPTALEKAQMQGGHREKEITWQGLVMIHAQVELMGMWEKQGFSEELRVQGEVEIAKQDRWMEEGIEHVGMWKRLGVERRKRLSLSEG